MTANTQEWLRPWRKCRPSILKAFQGRLVLQLGLFPIKAFSSPGGDSQMKLSPSGLTLTLLEIQSINIPLVDEGTSWNDLPRGLQPGLN